MRIHLAFVVIALALSAPSAAEESADREFGGFRQIPCRYFSNPKADPTGDLVDLMPEIRDKTFAYISAHGFFGEGQSFCNVIDYVKAECRMEPKSTIGAAVDRLFAKKHSGARLPRIPVCGA